MINKKKIFFSKMHGLGNDFVVIEKINQEVSCIKKIIKIFSNRYTGIGFDQLLLVERSSNKKFDFYYRIFNCDGSEVYQCGNGARCFAYFVYLKKLTYKKKIFIKTYNTEMFIHLFNKNNIVVNMGKPNLYFKQFPLFCSKQEDVYNIEIDNKIIKFGLVSIGNLHCVIIVKDIKTCSVNKIGSFLNAQHTLFPNGINVNFIEIISNKSILLRVYERGVGETRACGSGACASVVFGITQKLLTSTVSVVLLGGSLEVMWSGYNHFVYMNGPAEHIYDGYIYIDKYI
uniref:diaminopimelate epimerase n=1 Tax=Buchnera aphidicola TaxID=9 RepID=UPI003F5D0447